MRRFSADRGLFLLLLTGTLSPLPAYGQTSREIEKRLSFATAYGGYDWLDLGDYGSTSRIAVGGLHFWGHADLFGEVRRLFRGSPRARARKLALSRRRDRGQTSIPGRSPTDRCGRSWASPGPASTFSAADEAGGEGPSIQLHRFPVRAAIGILRKPLFLELMAQFVPDSHVDYPVEEPGGGSSLQRLEIP